MAMGLIGRLQPGVLRRAKLFDAFGVRKMANWIERLIRSRKVLSPASPPEVGWRLRPTESLVT